MEFFYIKILEVVPLIILIKEKVFILKNISIENWLIKFNTTFIKATKWKIGLVIQNKLDYSWKIDSKPHDSYKNSWAYPFQIKKNQS
jgi:hypothetical protein